MDTHDGRMENLTFLLLLVAPVHKKREEREEAEDISAGQSFLSLLSGHARAGVIPWSTLSLTSFSSEDSMPGQSLFLSVSLSLSVCELFRQLIADKVHFLVRIFSPVYGSPV